MQIGCHVVKYPQETCLLWYIPQLIYTQLLQMSSSCTHFIGTKLKAFAEFVFKLIDANSLPCCKVSAINLFALIQTSIASDDIQLYAFYWNKTQTVCFIYIRKWINANSLPCCEISAINLFTLINSSIASDASSWTPLIRTNLEALAVFFYASEQMQIVCHAVKYPQ